MRLLLALQILLLVAVRPASAADPDYQALANAVTDASIVPAYREMAAEMARLEKATAAHCAAPGPATFATAKDAFGRAMSAWQHAMPVSFGPVVGNGRATRIQFWPDKTGTGERQIRRALAAKDPALIAPGGLDGRSVALQGIGTYERLLYAADAPPYACALAAAIARFQTGLAAVIADEWTKPGGYRETMRTAAAGNSHYRNAKEAAADILKAAAATLDIIIDQKLERPLGSSLEAAAPNRAESWRSERSLYNIVANLETLTAWFATPGGLRDQLARVGAGPLGDGMVRSFENALALARAVPMPLSQAVVNADARKQVGALLEAVRDLRILVRNPVADELKLPIGFNALDGD